MNESPDIPAGIEVIEDETYNNPFQLYPLGFDVELSKLQVRVDADSKGSRLTIDGAGRHFGSVTDYEFIGADGANAGFPRSISIMLRAKVEGDSSARAEGLCGRVDHVPDPGPNSFDMFAVLILEPEHFVFLANYVSARSDAQLFVRINSTDLASIGNGSSARWNVRRRPYLKVQSFRVVTVGGGKAPASAT